MFVRHSIYGLLGLFVAAIVSSQAAGQIDAEAAPGEPFGVGRISVRLPEGATAGLSGVDALEITEANGRVLYPTRNAGLLDRVAAGGDAPGRLTIMFLFRGNDPLDITVYAPDKQTVRVTPGGRPRAHQRLLRQWWRQYNAAAEDLVDNGGYPAVIDHYLVAMLSRRMGLAPTVVGKRLFPSVADEQGIGLLLGTQPMHAAMLSEIMLGKQAATDTANEPLPEFALPPLRVPEAPADVRVEPIAMHVPEECYYVRFGTFANYRWMRDLMDDFGGDLGNMIAERGLDFDQSGRMETRIALRDTTLGKIFGGQVISDVAMIGMDMFNREGAAVGMLFEARSTALLSNDINNQRAAAKAARPNATLTTVKIGGRDVSLLHTPDNVVRSFYAVDGDYHLITSCEAMVKRFFEAGAGKRSLGGSAEFRHARSEMPTKRNDTIFAYLSDAFLQNLASPHYRIEMARRMRSSVEMDVLLLARMAAKAEGFKGESIVDLARGGFLPVDFGLRPDGSRIIVADDGTMSDSTRGARGSFLPVPDMAVNKVSAQEADTYARFAAAYRESLGRVEPIVFAIRRQAGDQLKLEGEAVRRDKPKGEIETLTIEARVTPFTGKTYQTLAKQLGPATKQYVAPLKGNLISVSAHVRNGSLPGLDSLGGGIGIVDGLLRGARPAAPPAPPRGEEKDKDDAGSRLMFLGLDDFSAPVATPDNLLGWLQVLQQTNGYGGSWPEAGMLARMLGMEGSFPEDEVGYREIFARLGVWGLKLNEFTVVALHKEELLETAKQLRNVEGERPAQIRVRAGDLSGTHVAGMLTGLGYGRTWTGSTGNARYLHRVAEQFHIPRADARPLAENLCGAKLICPLGGEYKVAERADGAASWISTAWQDAEGRRTGMPDGYVTPPLTWFRGLDAEAALEPGRLTIRADLVVERKSKASLGLPSILGK
jgi:hypothetical protein